MKASKLKNLVAGHNLRTEVARDVESALRLRLDDMNGIFNNVRAGVIAILAAAVGRSNEYYETVYLATVKQAVPLPGEMPLDQVRGEIEAGRAGAFTVDAMRAAVHEQIQEKLVERVRREITAAFSNPEAYGMQRKRGTTPADESGGGRPARHTRMRRAADAGDRPEGLNRQAGTSRGPLNQPETPPYPGAQRPEEQ
jgi:hypothetical protein